MIQSKLRDLEELQLNGCLTDTCLVGASDKMFIHRAMLLAAHVEPNPIWFDPDPGEEDGKVIVIIPDASTLELEAFVRRLYCTGDEVFYTAAPTTPNKIPGTPDDVFHTAVPQTPLQPPSQSEQVDSSEVKREKKQRLDMIDVRLRLLKIQRDEALAKHDKEAAKDLMSSIDVTNDEKRKLVDELEALDTSAESFDVKDECIDDDDKNFAPKHTCSCET